MELGALDRLTALLHLATLTPPEAPAGLLVRCLTRAGSGAQALWLVVTEVGALVAAVIPEPSHRQSPHQLPNSRQWCGYRHPGPHFICASPLLTCGLRGIPGLARPFGQSSCGWS